MFKIKCGGIYIISCNGYYYIGMSVDIFSRFGSHYTQLKMNKHSSKKFQTLFNNTKIEEWTFGILEYISLTEFKGRTGLKGKALENGYRKFLLIKEKEWMSKYSINYSLNENNKNFS